MKNIPFPKQIHGLHCTKCNEKIVNKFLLINFFFHLAEKNAFNILLYFFVLGRWSVLRGFRLSVYYRRSWFIKGKFLGENMKSFT